MKIEDATGFTSKCYFIPPKTKPIAVVGAGLSGLSCALSLAQKKYPVTVFEKEDGWGGTLRSHPRFPEFDGDIALQFSAVDVTFEFGTEIKAIEELGGFDAVYIATGAGGESFGLLGSWDPELFTTSDPRVFMGGALCGIPLMEGIAKGPELSKIIEICLQTGKAAGMNEKIRRRRHIGLLRGAGLLGGRRGAAPPQSGKNRSDLGRYGETDSYFRMRDLRKHFSEVPARDRSDFPL